MYYIRIPEHIFVRTSTFRLHPVTCLSSQLVNPTRCAARCSYPVSFIKQKMSDFACKYLWRYFMCVRHLNRQFGRGLWHAKVLQSVFLYPTTLSPVIRFQNASRSVLLNP